MINRMLGVGVAAMLTLVPVANGQTVAQTIYGETITEDEVDQRTKLNSLLSKQVTRQDVLGQLADDKDKIKEARDARVLPPDEYIEAFIKSRGEVLEKVLGQNGAASTLSEVSSELMLLDPASHDIADTNTETCRTVGCRARTSCVRRTDFRAPTVF
jgi:hypothetical protein